ncbi:DUF2865 domain-containing protein [Roseiarcus sp.]|uniref:DUF2865 domain-containing protein n=1 Tax=Roseiarcus sp. TaxID=1969460 RepID=UPI003F98A572
MTNPREHGVSSRVRRSGRWRKIRNSARPRSSAALVAAVAILLAGALLLAGGLAWARGGRSEWAPSDTAAPDAAATTAVDVQTDEKPKETSADGLAVCVRLCDGFFFPSATRSGGDEACAAQCPDAPTARYTEPAGSDRIEDAVSTHGALYAALPVANRYRTTLDDTCRCHRSLTRDYSASLLNDSTLRKGDVVMTPKGFMVFQGGKTRSITSSDFVALSQARSLPKDLRAALVDMERAGASQRQVGADSSPRESARRSEALPPLATAVSAK